MKSPTCKRVSKCCDATADTFKPNTCSDCEGINGFKCDTHQALMPYRDEECEGDTS